MSEKYTLSDICRVGRVTPRVIREWEKAGYLGKIERSGGNHRIYNSENMRCALKVAALRAVEFDDNISHILSLWKTPLENNICDKLLKRSDDLKDIRDMLMAGRVK
jgi:DNA-binding transcriptional MerR regulator